MDDRRSLFSGAESTLFSNARRLRKESTDAEDMLWLALRNRGVENRKFRRQHPIGRFIADFYCHECNLIVEVDGGHHNEADQQAYDTARTQVINELGVRVMRFANSDILDSLPDVLTKIAAALTSDLTPPLTLLAEEGVMPSPSDLAPPLTLLAEEGVMPSPSNLTPPLTLLAEEGVMPSPSDLTPPLTSPLLQERGRG